MIFNSFKFLDAHKKRDIGFGGKENLCNTYALIEAVEAVGLKKEEVLLWQIQRYFTYHRWLMVRDLYSKGLSVAQIAKKMGWKRNKVEKALSKEKGDSAFNILKNEAIDLEAENLFGVE